MQNALSAICLLLIGLFCGFKPALAVSSKGEPHSDFPSKWALVIGVNDFPDPKWHLQYAVKDAQDFHSYIIEHACFAKDHVRLLTWRSASMENVSKALNTWLPSVVGPKDLVVIYIRTRGTLPELDPGGNTYLAMSNTDSAQLNATAIAMDPYSRAKSDSSPTSLRQLSMTLIPSTIALPDWR
jgi:uncharacterized caspase-like protein